MSDIWQTKWAPAFMLLAVCLNHSPRWLPVTEGPKGDGSIHRYDVVRSPVPQYRVCVMTKDNKIWNPPIILTFADDQDAIRQSEQLVDGQDVELWEGPRLVRRINAKTA